MLRDKAVMTQMLQWSNARRNFLAAALFLASETIAPKVMPRPSEWAEQQIRLESEESPGSPGPYRCNWKPYLRCVHDAKFDHPDKLGVIIVKPSQIGVTRAVMNYALCRAAGSPVPMLYMLDTRDKGLEKANESIATSVDRSPVLKSLFSKQTKRKGENHGVRRRQLMNSYKFPGGNLDVVGAGSVSSVISDAKPLIFIDEYDRCEDAFPAEKTGSLYMVAKGRQAAAEHLSEMWIFSHPTTQDRGVFQLYTSLSDMRAWVFDCPHEHCKKAVDVKWDMVKYLRHDEKGNPIPQTAVLKCPHCSEIISDGQRAMALQHRHENAPLASGRFESTLSKEEAARRPYVGLRIHRLADPDVSVVTLAMLLATCKDETDIRGFFNIHLGEPYVPKQGVIGMEEIEAAIKPMQDIVLPYGRGGVTLVTVGVDVQKHQRGSTDPVLVASANAYNSRGDGFLFAANAVSGWDALQHWIEHVAVKTQTPEGHEGPVLSPDWVGIDAVYLTGQTLSFCRRLIFSKISGKIIRLVAFRNAPELKRDQPAVLAPDKKRVDPTRPHLGLVDYMYLQRHYWVDRRVRRVHEDRLHVVCQPPKEWIEHYTSQLLEVSDGKGTWDKPVETWVKVPHRRDDYLMADVYGEAAAALRGNLDLLGDIEEVENQPLPDQVNERNWITGELN